MRKLLCLLWAWVIQTSLYAQNTKIVIDNQTPGWLSSLLTYSQQTVVEDLTITGYINGSDMSFVNNLIKNQKLKILDMTNSTLISSEKGENYIWSRFLNFGDEKTLQKLKMPKTIKGVIWNVYGADYTPIILSHVDTLEMGCEDLSIFTKFQEYRDGESISKYPPLHLILLKGVKVIPDYCFSYSRGFTNPSASCVVTLSNSITHIGGRAFDSSFIFENFTFPDSIEYLGRHPVINDIANHSPVHGFAADNSWAYNSIVNISKDRFVFPESLRFYNSLDYVGSSLNGYSVVTYDSYSSDTIIVGSKCDTLFAKVKAKIAYFYNKKPVAFWSHEDMMIDTLYIPNGCMSEYLNEYNYYEALRPESGIQIKAIKEMKPIQGIEIICDNHTCQIGDAIRLKARVTPEDAFNKSIVWSSSDTSIASVNNKGVVTAMHGGDVWIKVISEENADVKDSCKIEVIQPVTGITLSQENCQLNDLGESVQLEATVLPENATNKDVSWTSSNELVCVVANGKVIATGFGVAVVKATSVDGGHTAICIVKVVQGVKSVVLNSHELTMKRGDTAQLLVNVLPDNAYDKTVKWTSSNDSLATVDSDGNVKALVEGEVFIKATSSVNDEVSDSCRVNIVRRIDVSDSAIVWNDTMFVYTGLSPQPTWKNAQEEYTVTVEIPELEKNVGRWETTVPFAFTDGVDTLIVNVPLCYTITPALLIVKPQDAERYVGEENPEFTIIYEGFVNKETEDVLTKKATAYTEATKESPIGQYPIYATGAETPNYELVYENGVLTVKDVSAITDILASGQLFDIYTISGLKVRQLQSLPKGIYVVNGRKLIVK